MGWVTKAKFGVEKEVIGFQNVNSHMGRREVGENGRQVLL